MAKSMMMDDEESLYASGESKQKEQPESVDQEESESTTALLPMKVAQGKHSDPVKEGDEIVLKVTKVYGDEVEVEYSETPAKDIGENEGGDNYGAEIDKIDKENAGSMAGY